jgi:hypothetical protein
MARDGFLGPMPVKFCRNCNKELTIVSEIPGFDECEHCGWKRKTLVSRGAPSKVKSKWGWEK